MSFTTTFKTAVSCLSLVVLASCTAAGIINHKNRVIVVVDGVEVAVAPYGANEYHAVQADELSRIRSSPGFAKQQDLLTRAVEKATGCKVVSAVMPPELFLLETIVRCPGAESKTGASSSEQQSQ